MLASSRLQECSSRPAAVRRRPSVCAGAGSPPTHSRSRSQSWSRLSWSITDSPCDLREGGHAEVHGLLATSARGVELGKLVVRAGEADC